MLATDVSYRCATTGETFDLSCEKTFVGLPNGFRKDSWSYSIEFGDISNPQRVASEVDFVAALLDLPTADRLRRSCDADVSGHTPGALSCGPWHRRAYISSVSVSDSTTVAAKVKLRVVLLDGAWKMNRLFEFRPEGSGSIVGSTHGYPYGYPYGYPCDRMRGSGIENESLVPCEFRMVIYGPTKYPSVKIGDNQYFVFTDVPARGRLEIDSERGTVTQFSPTGKETDVLDKAFIGDGEGSGQYIFEKIRPGKSHVSIGYNANVDITVFLEDGAVPWTSS